MRQLQIVDAAELALAYAAADYRVVLDGDSLPLRVGELATDLEAYWPASRYRLISAWNPASRPHSETSNQTADTQLVASIDASRIPRIAAWSQDSGGHWREPGWLLADPEPAAADLLAREFGQAALLAWERGEPVRLRMLMPCPSLWNAEICPAAGNFVDWVE